MKLVADINIPYLKGVLEPFFDEVLYLPGNKINPEIVKDTDALLIRTRTNCNAQLLDGSKVKFIGSATIGYDHIDTNYCNQKGIAWATAPGCNAGGVLQWVICSLLYLSSQKNFTLSGKTIGVVGVGNVGKKVAIAAEALRMRVLCCDPPRKRNESLKEFVDFEAIIKNSDIITFHVPLSYSGDDKTYHLVDRSFFENIKENVVIINSSRGEVVDTVCLQSAIESGKVIASALDVWEGEPNVLPEIIDRIDIATPHIAGYSIEGKVNGTRMVVDALSKHFKLGIEPWNPNPNPLISKTVIDSNPDLKCLASKTYDILSDDRAFRANPANFEKLRNEYNFRREFSAYQIKSADQNLIEILSKLGFQINNQ